MPSEIIFTVLSGPGGDIGKVILNRPQSLNALTRAMCVELKIQLEEWEKDSAIKAVMIVSSQTRAFCAGGDIRAIYEICHEHKDYSQALEFFADEYALNEVIFNYPKPYIALLDGITMGGGVGISIHGSHPIATERLKLAMPETAIGFFPDVGVGYRLARLPNYVGEYLGLTGKIIQARDAYRLDWVKATIDSQRLPELEKVLTETPFSRDDFSAVSEIIGRFHTDTDLPLDLNVSEITKTFAYQSVEEILSVLQQSSQPWEQQTAAQLLTKSPLSLKITLEHLRRCRQANFAEVIRENLVMAKKFIASHDFMEGIRAVVIDKDSPPLWQPPTLGAIDEKIIQTFFS